MIKSSIFDHFSVTFNLSTAAPNHMQQREQLRDIRHIDQQSFERDLVEKLAEINLQHDVNTIYRYNSYTDAVNYIMNRHAPVKTQVRRNRERQPWLTDDIHHARQLREANERRWRATGLDVHRQIYVQHRSKVNMMITEAKRKFHCDKLTTGDPKTCFIILNSLLKLSAEKLPTHTRIKTLCDDFGPFF